MLADLGTTGIEVKAEGGDCVLIAYFPPAPGLRDRLLAALPQARLRPVAIPDVDWVARFRAGFRRFEAGGFVLAPPWDLPSPIPPRLLVVEPGPAFGTGTHETTQLCLRAVSELASLHSLRSPVLDLGCGTGVLGLAALRCGAGLVVALDSEPDALRGARHHARLNGLALELVRGDAGRPLQSGRFGLVLANLTAPLLLAERDVIAALPARGGALVLSGFLLSEASAVREGYAAGGHTRLLEQGDWGALVVEAAA